MILPTEVHLGADLGSVSIDANTVFQDICEGANHFDVIEGKYWRYRYFIRCECFEKTKLNLKRYLWYMMSILLLVLHSILFDN